MWETLLARDLAPVGMLEVADIPPRLLTEELAEMNPVVGHPSAGYRPIAGYYPGYYFEKKNNLQIIFVII